MLNWLSQNSPLISGLASVGMLLVWIFYAQLLYNGFRRQRRPRVLINKAILGADLDSPCLICNMSSEPIFIENVLVDLETTADTYSATVTDADEETGPSETRQGPLDSGKCLEVLRFREFLKRAADGGGLKLIDSQPEDPEVTLKSLTVTVISMYGPEDHPFGAARKFELSCDEPGPVRVNPTSIDTTRLTSGQGKKRAEELLKGSIQ